MPVGTAAAEQTACSILNTSVGIPYLAPSHANRVPPQLPADLSSASPAGIHMYPGPPLPAHPRGRLPPVPQASVVGKGISYHLLTQLSVCVHWSHQVEVKYHLTTVIRYTHFQPQQHRSRHD